MADAFKDDQTASTQSCARYYFPEIPCSVEKDRAHVPSQRNFVSATLDRDDETASLNASPSDSESTSPLIEEAFNKGKDLGRAEMTDAQQDSVDQAAASLKAAVKELVHIRQQDIERMETETVRLAMAIAKKIIGHASEHGQIIDHVVKTAMKKVADPRHLTVRLNPQDIDTVNGFKPDLFLADDFDAVLRFEADETIKRGGCIIETRLGDVDARIEQQIKTMDELLTAHLPKRPAEG